MRRREFITLLGGGAAAWPLAARAQQAMPVIGFLHAASPDLYAGPVRAFHQGLNDTAFVEGRNVAIEYRWAHDEYNRLPEMAADLVRKQVSAIVAAGAPSSPLAAKAATTTIPIIFNLAVDPVEAGFVASLSRPGGNLTGVSNLNVELIPKRLELLHEILPKATLIAVLVNPANDGAETQARNARMAAGALGLQVEVLHASTERDLTTVFATLTRLRAGGLLIAGDGFFISRSEQLAALAIRYAVPAIFQFRTFVAAGGLISYGDSITDQYRLLGVYTGRILKGEKPSELPVQQSTKSELTINLKTAKALGIIVPLLLRGRADEVIE